MYFKEECVSLAKICPDERFHITTRTDCDDLCNSVRHIGLINPPIVLSYESGFIVVCGFRRIEACRHLQLTNITVRITDASESECLKTAISDNAFQRTLNLIEISRSLHKLSKFYENNELSGISECLGLPATPSLIRKLKILCKMPQSFQDGILSEAVALPTALELQKIEQKEAVAIAELFIQLVPSLNKQREILTLLQEISVREDIPIQNILDNINNIMQDSEPDKNQKLRKIRSYLKQRRFPTLSHAEEQFEKSLKQLKLGAGLDLIPPKYFEGDTYSFSLQFRTLEELYRQKARLDQALENTALKHYFINIKL